MITKFSPIWSRLSICSGYVSAIRGFNSSEIRPVKYLHIAGLGYAIVMQIFGWFCPLTHLEAFLRAKRRGRGAICMIVSGLK
jgi:hypothetical protein